MGQKVIKVDTDGAVLWEWASEDPVSHIVADSDGLIYASSGNFVSKLGRDGKLLWRFDAEGIVYSLMAVESKILVGWEYGLVELDPEGDVLWDYYRPEDC